MKTKKTLLNYILSAALVLVLVFVFIGCKESPDNIPEIPEIPGEPKEPIEPDPEEPYDPALQKATSITSFKFLKEDIGRTTDLSGVINQSTRTITFTTQAYIRNIEKLPAVYTLNDTGWPFVDGVQQRNGITRNDFRKDVVYRLNDNVAYTVRFVSPQATGLPVITIDTLNNAPIADRENWVTMTFSLSDPNNPLNDIPPLPNQQIRGRGNASWVQEPATGKRPYRIRFRNNQQQSPFGLPPERNWVVLKVGSEINTPFGFELAKRLGLQYTCSYNAVQLFLNGNYRGTYLFTEHRQADPQVRGAPGRPKVDLNEGWFVEVDRYYKDEPKFRGDQYILPVQIKTPDHGGLGDNHVYTFVRNEINTLLNLMAADSFPENGYRDLVDIDTFVKYLMVQTIVINNDLFRPRAELGQEIGSTFFYKDKDGKISAGPLWDLDWTFAPWAFEGRSFNANQHPYQIHPWFKRFHDDPVFHARYKEIWNNNYTNVIRPMATFVTEYGEKLTRGALENQKRWSPNDLNWYTWHIGHIRDHFNTRHAYLNTEYNRVDVIPASRNYGNATTPQTFTLVAFGQMTNLSASLARGTAASPFEITTALTQTQSPTGDGAYLATITVRPKAGLAAGTHTDTLRLSGSNQGRTFAHNNISLSYTR